ncbi:MAG: CHASE2 domain-containing protein [bacterium]|nr:CHASE2 domain-containing protein [bacterium]
MKFTSILIGIAKIPFWLKLIVNTLALLTLSAFLQSGYFLWMYGSEQGLLERLNRVKKVFREESKYSEQFIFINTAHHKQLISLYDESGYVEQGVDVITDRQSLTYLISVLKASDARMLVFDLSLEDKTEYDSLFQSSLDSWGPIIAASKLNNNGEIQKPIVAVPTGLSDVNTLRGLFLKYRFDDKGFSSLGLKMAEVLDSAIYDASGVFGKLNGSLIFNDFILYNRITYNDITQNKYVLLNIYDLEELGPNASEFIGDRTVVVGDFDNDKFDSIDGQISGSLIHVNAYLALKEGDASISFWFMIYMVLSYLLMSFISLNDRMIEKFQAYKYINRYLKPLKPFAIWIIFLIMTSVSFFVFNKLISILYLTLYLSFIDLCNKWIKKRLS